MLGAYLHQDFDLDYETAEDALNNSVTDAGRERLTRAAAELHAHRRARDDEEATRCFVNELCDYQPPGDDLTYVAWLDHVQAVLKEAISGWLSIASRPSVHTIRRAAAARSESSLCQGRVSGVGGARRRPLSGFVERWGSRVVLGPAMTARLRGIAVAVSATNSHSSVRSRGIACSRRRLTT